MFTPCSAWIISYILNVCVLHQFVNVIAVRLKTFLTEVYLLASIIDTQENINFPDNKRGDLLSKDLGILRVR